MQYILILSKGLIGKDAGILQTVENILCQRDSC